MYSKFYVFMFVTYTRMTAVNRIFFIVSVTIYMSNGAVAGVSVVTLGAGHTVNTNIINYSAQSHVGDVRTNYAKDHLGPIFICK